MRITFIHLTKRVVENTFIEILPHPKITILVFSILLFDINCMVYEKLKPFKIHRLS